MSRHLARSARSRAALSSAWASVRLLRASVTALSWSFRVAISARRPGVVRDEFGAVLGADDRADELPSSAAAAAPGDIDVESIHLLRVTAHARDDLDARRPSAQVTPLSS